MGKLTITFRNSLYATLVVLWGTSQTIASELVFKPTNPSFGGDSFNSSHLLATAQAQNSHEKPEEPVDPLANFQRTITSSLLNRVSFQIAEQIFGENAAESGQFQLGDTLLSFQREGNIVRVTLTDGITGATTTIDVPASGI